MTYNCDAAMHRDLRIPLRLFARCMEFRLRENDHKSGWDCCTDDYLLRRLKEELIELETSLQADDDADIQTEAADVANFAMMIYDRHLLRNWSGVSS